MASNLMVHVPEQLHAAFRKKLIDNGWTQKAFWERSIRSFVNDEDNFLIPEYFIKHLGGDNKRAHQVMLGLINAYVNKDK